MTCPVCGYLLNEHQECAYCNAVKHTLERQCEDFSLACGQLALALWRGYKEFLLKIGECVVKFMDWMNE